MTKAELRRRFLQQRRALAPGEVERRSQLIAWYFFNYVEKNGLADMPAVVHSFLPIRRHNEVDTWPIIRSFWSKFGHISISVPVADMTIGSMSNYTIFSDTPLIENKSGIPEPRPDSRHQTDLHHIVAVLVPLLAFDRQGHRVGYGGGYYDRFLAECRPDCAKIGLSLFDPVERIDDTESTDVRLNACITPERIWLFSE